MITEKRLLKISGKYALIGLALSLFFWFVIYDCGICHAQTQTGYRVPVRIDIGGGRMTGDMWCQYGTNGVRFIFGTQTVTQVGTTGVITGTIANNSPSLDILYGGGSISANFEGFNAVYVAGSQVGTSGALSSKLDAVGGVGTNNTFNRPTLAGQGTITATFNSNGLDISPAELSMVDGATISLNKATGSITSHTHTGGDGTTQISHNNITGTGTNSHSTIDTFIASKAQASGLASLDANSFVAQNPTSGTSTPGISKIPISLGTGFLDDSWLSSVISKLGTDIQLGTETTGNTNNISEGSTNKYYTDARVNAAFGSSSIHSLSDVADAISEGDFLKKVGGNIVGGSNTVTVAFSDVTGSATASQLPLISGLSGSATASQLPTVFRLYGTTTEQLAGAYGQLYVQSTNTISTTGSATGFGTLTTASLVSYYRLTDLGDSFGGNTLTNFGTTTFVAGKYGNCATFNGTSQYLRASVLSTATTNISMFAWVFVPTSSEMRGFLNHGVDGADTNGYALTVGSNSVASSGNNLIGHIHGVDTIVFGLIGTGWHHVGITRDATTWRGYIDKVQSGTTSVNNPNAPSDNFTIGRNNASAVNYYWNDKIDDVVFYNKTLSAGEIKELYDNTGGFTNYTQYSAKYKDPANGNTVLTILTQGTATAEASYIYCNATTTVFGLGTSTAITATTTAYTGWFDGAVRATAFNVASTEEIKENIQPINIKPDLLDAEVEAKQRYIKDNKASWVTTNKGSYTYSVAQTGTGTVTYVDTVAMEKDYKKNIELQWASELNRGTLTENVQKEHEKKFWQEFNSIQPKSWNPKENPKLTRRGFVVEEVPDKLKGDDKQTIDPMAVLANQQMALQAMLDAIERLGGTVTTIK